MIKASRPTAFCTLWVCLVGLAWVGNGRLSFWRTVTTPSDGMAEFVAPAIIPSPSLPRQQEKEATKNNEFSPGKLSIKKQNFQSNNPQVSPETRQNISSIHHTWGDDTILLEPILSFVNDTYFFSETRFTKHERRYGPFPSFLVHRNNHTAMWFPVNALQTKRMNTILENRLAILLPHFQNAFNVLLWKYRRRFSAITAALESSRTVPLILDLSDSRGCGKMNYNVTSSALPNGKLGSLATLTLSRDSECDYAFPIPTYKTFEYALLGDVNGTNRWWKPMKKWRRDYNWTEKIPKAYWRGGCNGENEQDGNYRISFIRKCQALSALRYVDVRPTNGRCGVKPIDPEPPEMSMKYKAVVDIDGTSWSERFPRLLCYNSAVIKIHVRHDQEEYFMHRLTPNVHYIPASLDNFTAVAKDVLAPENDGRLKDIVANANSWCRENLMIENLQLDFLETVNDLINTMEDSWLEDWKEKEPSFVGSGPLHGGFTDQILYGDELNILNWSKKVDSLI